MVRRDPDTGRFVSGDGLSDQYDDIEHVHFQDYFSVPASSADGSTGQNWGQRAGGEGVVGYDVDDLIDRQDLADLIWCYHQVVVYVTPTQTADGAARALIEISSSPSRNAALEQVDNNAGAVDDQIFATSIEHAGAQDDDSQDTVGAIIGTTVGSPFSDGSTGVGGAPGDGRAEWEGHPMAPVLDARDEMFIHAILEWSNVDDAAIHVDVDCWHVLGVHEEALDQRL